MNMNMTMNGGRLSPALPGDLADQILLFALRLLVAPTNGIALPDINTNVHARSIHSLLTITQPSSSDTKHAALQLMWWIDLDVASRHGRTDLLTDLVHAAHRYPRTRPLKYSPHAVDAASAAGHVRVLDWWLKHDASPLALTYTSAAFDLAAANGHLECLQWWMHQSVRGLARLKSTHRAVDRASANGHVHVLRWLLTHAQLGQFAFRVTIEGIAAAVKHDFRHFGAGGERPTLEWWLRAHIRNEYFTVDELSTRCEARQPRLVLTPAVQAAMCGDLAALEVLDRRSLYLPRTKEFDLVVAACRSGRVDVVEWCWEKIRGLPDDPYDDRNWYGIGSGGANVDPMSECFVSASEGGHVHILEWLLNGQHGGFVESILDSVVVERALVAASREGHVDVLDWWNTFTGRVCECLAEALNEASANGRVSVLQWWKHWAERHGQEFQCTEMATTLASRNCQLSVLEWWLDGSGCELRFDAQAIVASATTAAHVPVLEFWKHQGALEGMSLAFGGQDLVVLDWWWSQGQQFEFQQLQDDLALPSYLLYFCLARPSHSMIPACKLMEFAIACHDPMLIAAVVRSQSSLMGVVSEAAAAHALEAASYRGKLDFVSWWVSASGFSVPANGRYLEYASAGGQIHVLTWWVKHSGLALATVDAHMCLELAKWSGELDEVMVWWYESGLFGLSEKERSGGTQDQSGSLRHFKLEDLCQEISILSKRYSLT